MIGFESAVKAKVHAACGKRSARLLCFQLFASRNGAALARPYMGLTESALLGIIQSLQIRHLSATAIGNLSQLDVQCGEGNKGDPEDVGLPKQQRDQADLYVQQEDEYNVVWNR